MQRASWSSRLTCYRVIPIVLLAFAVGTNLLLADECAEVTAFSTKTKKAQRERLILEAREQAIQELAKQAWSVAVGSEIERRYRRVTGRSGDPGSQRFIEDIAIQENLFFSYDVPDLLRDGNHAVNREGKKRATVRYCVSDRVFEEARRHLREKRRQAVENMRERFADIERRIRDRDLGVAARSLATAKIEVQSQVMQYEDYRSRIDNRNQSFYAWLSEWTEEAAAGRDYAAYLTAKANERIDEGHLTQASQYLDQALAADPQLVAAHLKKDEIERIRRDRTRLLRRAVDLAEVGRFSAAKGKVKDAEHLDSDERVSLENTQTTIQGLKAQYRVYNPRASIALYLGVGSLAADTGAIKDRLNMVTTDQVNGSIPISFGLDLNARIGRHFVYSLSGSFGFSSDDSDSGQTDTEMFDLLQAATGFGVRTVRKEKRKFVFKAIGGIAFEQVSLNIPSGTVFEDSDSQTGAFVRLAMEWPSVMLFVQHGFGFENDEETVDSLIVWSDNLQVGIGFIF